MFQPGQSGNPSGRPKENGEVKALARVHTKAAILTLAAIMKDGGAKEAARVAAAVALLDRGYGKPAQSLEHSGELTLGLTGVLEGLPVKHDDSKNS